MKEANHERLTLYNSTCITFPEQGINRNRVDSLRPKRQDGKIRGEY